MNNKQIAKVDMKRISPQPTPSQEIAQEISDKSDYIIGTLYILFGIAFTIILAYFYLIVHGGLSNTFSFWATGDLRWVEVLFWSLLTVHVWNMTDVAYAMSYNLFQKRYLLWYLSRMLEAPPISLALVVVVMNFGISFGDATISLQDAPILVVIAFAIISAYFSRQTIDALQSVANWLVEQVKAKRKTVDNNKK